MTKKSSMSLQHAACQVTPKGLEPQTFWSVVIPMRRDNWATEPLFYFNFWSVVIPICRNNWATEFHDKKKQHVITTCCLLSDSEGTRTPNLLIRSHPDASGQLSYGAIPLFQLLIRCHPDLSEQLSYGVPLQKEAASHYNMLLVRWLRRDSNPKPSDP